MSILKILMETAEHLENLLLRQPEARCFDEGTAGGNDSPFAEGHQGLVPKQALQGQENTNQNAGEANAT